MTLSKVLVPTRSLPVHALMVLGGALLIGLGAQASVPMFPVPMTLQTLAITLIGLTYGSRLAAVTVAVYLAEGAMGLPVFSNGAAGVTHLFGPTGGFLWGFVAMAWLTGWMVENGFGKGFLRLFAAAIVPGMLLFVPGLAMLWAVTPLGLSGALAAGVTPFLLGAVLKALIATLAVSGVWAALSTRR